MKNQHLTRQKIAQDRGETIDRAITEADYKSELEYPPTQNERVKEVIRRFSAARLLVEGQDTEGNPYMEPAHNTLVRGWQDDLMKRGCNWARNYLQNNPNVSESDRHLCDNDSVGA